jgi:DNA-binding MarR family transcriptional regulator
MSAHGPPGLGTLLRHLVELLDRDVEQQYRRLGLQYRPRFTPVMRALVELDAASIGSIARHAQLTHSATSQTVVQMERANLVRVEAGADARERVVCLSRRALNLLPQLKRIWAATRKAQIGLERELAAPLTPLLRQAIDALQCKSFDDRIADGRSIAPPETTATKPRVPARSVTAPRRKR